MLFMVNLSAVLKMSFLFTMALTKLVAEEQCNPYDEVHKKQYESINKKLNDLYHDTYRMTPTPQWNATECRWEVRTFEAQCHPNDKVHKKQYESVNKQLNDLYHDSLNIPATLEWDATNCRWNAILPKI